MRRYNFRFWDCALGEFVVENSRWDSSFCVVVTVSLLLHELHVVSPVSPASAVVPLGHLCEDVRAEILREADTQNLEGEADILGHYFAII